MRIYRSRMGFRVLLLIFALVIICIYAMPEGFSSRRDKASAIYNWFGANSTPSYANFRRDMGGKSNIVEYEDVLNLLHKRNMTLSSVESVV